MIASSALYVARRVTAISERICSLYASTCRSVAASWSSSAWCFATFCRCPDTSPYVPLYASRTLRWSSSAASRICAMIEWFSCTFSRFICSFASCCCIWYSWTPMSSRAAFARESSSVCSESVIRATSYEPFSCLCSAHWILSMIGCAARVEGGAA